MSIIWFCLGAVIRWSDALDCIHEWFHRIAGTQLGYHVVGFGQSYVSWREAELSATVYAAGYAGEVLLYSLFGMVFACIPMWKFSGFFVGVLAVIMFVVPKSDDMAHTGIIVMYAIEVVAAGGLTAIVSIMANQRRKEWKDRSCSGLLRK